MNYSAYIKILRPHQWIKNLFIFAGILFSGKLLHTELLMNTAVFFMAFCLISSAVYIINDIKDLDNDLKHPEKKFRPLPQKQISEKNALIYAFFLTFSALIIAILTSRVLLLIILSYFLLQLLYTYKFKQLPVIDVFCISFGFILRMLAGTITINIAPSSWIIICTMMISLFLGFSKRYSELKNMAEGNNRQSRRVLNMYSENFLNMMLTISASATLLSYSLYTISPQTLEAHGTDALVYTLPFVLFGIIRYLFIITSSKGSEDTAKLIIKDYYLMINIFLYILTLLFILKGK